MSVPSNAYRTHQGHMLDFADPDATVFDLQDIAHHLARLCRFNGSTDEFYSVASHSVYVALELERQGYSTRVVQSALLHDSPEAYLGDVTSGLKRLLPEYRALEKRFAMLIEKRFGVYFDGNPTIKDADIRARLAEARDLFREYPYPRELLHGGEDGREAFTTPVVPQTPDEAEWAFMGLARRLGLWGP